MFDFTLRHQPRSTVIENPPTRIRYFLLILLQNTVFYTILYEKFGYLRKNQYLCTRKGAYRSFPL